MTGLEQQVKDIIEHVYCCEYTRELEVKIIDNDYYILKLFLHDPNFGALCIGKQCESDLDFLAYVEQELKNKKLTRSRQFKLIIYGDNESEERF